MFSAQSRLCVLWKPPGWSVVVGRDDFESVSEAPSSLSLTTDQMEGLAWPASRDQDISSWLMRTFGKTNPIVLDAKRSHGLVHRLDKMTSGGLLWASSYSGLLCGATGFRFPRDPAQGVSLLERGLDEAQPTPDHHCPAPACRRRRYSQVSGCGCFGRQRKLDR